MTKKVVVVDYGIGNVFSVCNALRQIGGDPVLTGDPAAIRSADRVILPGVGAFGRAMEALNKAGLTSALRDFVDTQRPFLGICIGMQVLMDASAEFGSHEGLGFVSGKVERIPDHGESGNHLRIPHIGWATLQKGKAADDSWIGPAVTGNAEGGRSVYFVHSYHCVPADPDHRVAYVDYDGSAITASIRRDNIVGVQFHPERSGIVGQRILQSFLDS